MATHEAEQGGHRTGLTVTAAAFAFLVLRLFAVSGYNWHTAFAVLHTLDLDDTIGLVLGTVMAESLAAVLVLALLVPVGDDGHDRDEEQQRARQVRPYGLSAGGRVKQVALWASRHLVALIGLAMLIGAATITTPWLPLERIGLRTGTQLRGFVLEAEPGFLKVLTEQDREFHILTDQDVTSREEIAAH